MLFYSHKDSNHKVSFSEALLSSLAPDGGLYMPEKIPSLSEEEKEILAKKSLAEVAFVVAQKYIRDEIPEGKLKEICDEAYNFPVPFVRADFIPEQPHYFLELIHGPTYAFKDFAARFMARCVQYFLSQNGETRKILVATSGDTGGAIGNGFLGLDNVSVNILYPKGGVSEVQEKQLTTMGKNINAIEVEGNFDDCQRLVKEAFADRDFNTSQNLMSANSINVGRILPQSFYYVWSALKLSAKHQNKLVSFSIPSGNLGNSTGCLVAKLMGAPIDKIIVGHNANHPFVDYIQTGTFTPVKGQATISNAMDIGHPNNYYRITHLLPNHPEVTQHFWGAHFNDDATRDEMLYLKKNHDYIACPHTAVGALATKAFIENVTRHDTVLVTAATAHPAKFIDTVEETLAQKIDMPVGLKEAFSKKKQAVFIKPKLEDLKNVIN